MGNVTTSGPLFDGRAVPIMRRATVAVKKAVANDVVSSVRQAFTGTIRVNHGVFISTLTVIGSSRAMQWDKYTMPVVVDDPMADLVVTSSDAMYGPWLEGTGSRNETTRFKGYHGFRLAAQAADVRAEHTANDALTAAVTELNVL